LEMAHYIHTANNGKKSKSLHDIFYASRLGPVSARVM
jgi:hypothetical protein